MKQSVRIFALLFALLLAFAAAGCSKDNTKAVAEVNGAKVTYMEYYDLLATYASYYSATPETLSATLGLANANSFREMIVEELVNEKLMLSYAKEKGMDTLTAEELATVESNYASFFEGLHQSFVDEVTAEAAEGVDIEAEASRREAEYIKEQGYTDEYVRSYYTDSIILDKVYLQIIEEVEVTEEEINTYYTETLAEQEALAESDPATAFSNYLNAANPVNLYIPEGLSYVKHILIKFPAEVENHLKNLSGEEYDKAWEEALADIEERAQMVLDLVEEGQDFDLLVTKYNEDPGMKSEPYMSEGYEVYPNAPFEEHFLAAALELKEVGQHSGLVATSFGYHILKCVNLGESGPVELDDTLREEIKAILKESESGTVWQAKLDEWKADAKIVYHEENYLTPEAES